MHQSATRVSRVLEKARPLASAFVLATIVGSGCATPASELLSEKDVADSVSKRVDRLPDLSAVLNDANLRPLGVERPSVAAMADPSTRDFWRAAAIVFAPEVREARQNVARAAADAEAAGRPGPIGVMVDQTGIDDERETEIGVVFDLLGIFGVGRSIAARELADANCRAAIGELEVALWAAIRRVERDLDAYVVRRAEVALFERHLAESKDDVRTIELLASRGRVARRTSARVDTVLSDAEIMLAELRKETAMARAALAVSSGILFDDPAFEKVPGFDPSSPDAAYPSGPSMAVGAIAVDADLAQLARRHPDLRRRALDYVVAEANVRAAAAEAWPEIRIGPKPVIDPARIVPGGLLEIEWPLFRNVDAEVESAVSMRTAARQSFEDRLVEIDARRRAAAVALRESVAALAAAKSSERSSDELRRAARAKMRTDPSAIEEWTMAFADRTAALRALGAAARDLAAQRSDFLESTGPSETTPSETEISPLEARP